MSAKCSKLKESHMKRRLSPHSTVNKSEFFASLWKLKPSMHEENIDFFSIPLIFVCPFIHDMHFPTLRIIVIQFFKTLGFDLTQIIQIINTKGAGCKPYDRTPVRLFFVSFLLPLLCQAFNTSTRDWRNMASCTWVASAQSLSIGSYFVSS